MYRDLLRSELNLFHRWSFKDAPVLFLFGKPNDIWSLLHSLLMYTISSVFKHDNVIDSQIDLLVLIQVFHVLIIVKKLI